MNANDLTDTEKTTIAVLLREAIAADSALTSGRVEHLKAILDKVDPELAENPSQGRR
jgi:hypothetical protein